MGWTTVYDKPENSAAGMKEYFEPQYNCESKTMMFKFLDLSKKGNALYVLYEIISKYSKNKTVTCDVVLISFEDGAFSYKTLNESSGPFAYEPPVKFLKILKDYPAETEYAKDWRKNCYREIEHKKEKKKIIAKLKFGTKIKFEEPQHFGEEVLYEFRVYDLKKKLFTVDGGAFKGCYRIKDFARLKFDIVI